MAKRRAEARAQRELFEELKRDMVRSFADRDDTSKRQDEEMHKWGAFPDAAETDRSKEYQVHGRSNATKGEKLGWDGKQRIKSKTLKSEKRGRDHVERFTVSTPEGSVHLKRVVDLRDEGQGFWMKKDDPRLNTFHRVDPFSEPSQAVAWLLTDEYSPLYLDQTLPLKLHPSFYKLDSDDPYFREDYQPGDLYPRFESKSVLRHDPRLVQRVDWRGAFQDLLDVHYKGSVLPRSHIRDQPHQVPGRMGAGPWIAHLVDQGYLGPQWHQLRRESTYQPYRFRYGNSCDAWAVPPSFEHLYARYPGRVKPLPMFGGYEREHDALGLISSQTKLDANDEVELKGQAFNESGGPSERGWQNGFSDLQESLEHLIMWDPPLDGWASLRPSVTKAGISLIRDPETEQATLRAVDRVLRMVENSELEDQMEGIFEEAIANLAPEEWEPPNLRIFSTVFNEVDQLMRQEFHEEWKAAKKAVDPEHPAVYGVTLTEPHKETSSSSATTTSDLESSASFSSSSSYVSKYDSNTVQSPDTILSTLTTVQTRTLPDGTLETKRILKKRFADGREESNESTETHNRRNIYSVVEKPELVRANVDSSKASEPQVPPTGEKRPGKGWFWI